MGMSRCYSLMKCLLILFNIVFLCVGCGACAFAAWALWDGRAGESSEGRAGLCAVAVWGAALALGALVALCGAIRSSASLLAAAFALLALTAVAEGAAAWWGAAHLPQLRQALQDSLEHTIKQDYGVSQSRTQVIDAIQKGLECCGAEGPRDWQQAVWSLAQQPEPSGTLDLSVKAPAAHYWVPASCCDPAAAGSEECAEARRVPAASGGAAGLHAAGCGPRVTAALGRVARLPLAVGGALAAAHALSLLLALALCLRAAPRHRYKA